MYVVGKSEDTNSSSIDTTVSRSKLSSGGVNWVLRFDVRCERGVWWDLVDATYEAESFGPVLLKCMIHVQL